MAFQNPAQNFAERRLNLGDLVTLSPHATYLVRSDSHYPETGILRGSVLAVDRSLTPQHGHIIVAELDGELVLRRLLTTPVAALQELGDEERITPVGDDHALPVWGVVACVLTDMAGVGFNQPVGE